MKKRKNKEKTTWNIIGDKTDEWLNESIFQQDNRINVTNVTKLGFPANYTDSEIITTLNKKYERFIFVTSDKEKKKDKCDFIATEKSTIVKLGSSLKTKNIKIATFKKIIKNGSNLTNIKGRNIIATTNGYQWTSYKRSKKKHFKKWKKDYES